MSDRRPYGDDPSMYPYDYFSDQSSSSDYVNDPGMDNLYYGTLDNNLYSGNPGWGSAYPNQPIPTFDDNTCAFLPLSKPDNTTNSDTGSDDSAADLHVQLSSLQISGTSAQARKRNKKKGKPQPWMATWNEIMASTPKLDLSVTSMDYFVCVDGYFRRGRKGGYGVLIRDNIGRPVVASTMTTTDAVSFFYHTVQGVHEAVKLAVDYRLEDIRLFCNAKHVARLFNVVCCQDKCCIHSGDFDVICKGCVKSYAVYYTKTKKKTQVEMIFSLLRNVALQMSKFVGPVLAEKIPRKLNKAADFLGKNGTPKPEELLPSDFPDELKEILCSDYDCKSYGLPPAC